MEKEQQQQQGVCVSQGVCGKAGSRSLVAGQVPLTVPFPSKSDQGETVTFKTLPSTAYFHRVNTDCHYPAEL